MWPDYVLERFGKTKRSSSRRSTWTARCPAHDDRSPSLSLWMGDKKRVLVVRCWAQNCSVEDILSRVNLTMSDLFHPDDRGQYQAKPLKAPKIVKTYDYLDESGNVLYQAVRYEPKSFRVRRPNADGSYDWSLPEHCRRVLYNLPWILERDIETVCLCEGEKDADLLFELGYLGTTNVTGAGAWLDEYAKSLVDRRVAVVIDNDEPGIERGDHLLGNLMRHGARSVRLVVPPKGKDVYDWLSPLGADAKEAFKRVALASREWK